MTQEVMTQEILTPAVVLCVYYKVEAAQHANLAPRVRQFQAALSSSWPGLVCELLQRPEVAAGVETWMETYRHADGLSDTVVDAIAQSAATAGLPAPRHVERFVSLLSPCAEPRSSLKNP
jgi:hypothetical protein